MGHYWEYGYDEKGPYRIKIGSDEKQRDFGLPVRDWLMKTAKDQMVTIRRDRENNRIIYYGIVPQYIRVPFIETLEIWGPPVEAVWL